MSSADQKIYVHRQSWKAGNNSSQTFNWKVFVLFFSVERSPTNGIRSVLQTDFVLRNRRRQYSKENGHLLKTHMTSCNAIILYTQYRRMS